MIGVGYLDPGNWATDLAAGSQYGYSLLFVILLANIMATVLQYLCIKLGIVTGNDLAMACRKHFSPNVNIALYLLCELAIIATDLAEVIGTAIALNLLFSLPLVWGVALTSLDVLIVLTFWGSSNLRKFEFAIIGLVGLVAICFLYLVVVSKPQFSGVLAGYLPSTSVFHEDGQLYLAIGIIGATIMPHNLYLHSSIVRYRSNNDSEGLGSISELPPQPETISQDIVHPMKRLHTIGQNIKYSNLDSIFALYGALFINSAILIVASAEFYKTGDGKVAEIKDASLLLVKHLGPAAGFAFALALFCAGQSSTITGTLAGQVVTEGFLGPGAAAKFKPSLQRLATRLLAIVPAMTAALLTGEKGMNELLVGSQVVLSLQLPFAVWPLVWVTCGASDGEGMKVTFERDLNEAIEGMDGDNDDADDETESGVVVDFKNSIALRVASVIIALLITAFNIILLIKMTV
ncbi:NRAMP family [Chytriomyces sp. MP71]|nr:NRAMP family [Chytriomyces sp. MP71]